jgi:hypothetical protein
MLFEENNLWKPGDPVPQEITEAAAGDYIVVAHNAPAMMFS